MGRGRAARRARHRIVRLSRACDATGRDHRNRHAVGARRQSRDGLAKSRRWRVRDRQGDAVRSRRAIAAILRPRSPTTIPPGISRALEQRRWSRCDQIAVLAAAEALDDAGVDSGSLDPERVGVMLGAGTSDLLSQRGLPCASAREGRRRARSRRWSATSSRTRQSTSSALASGSSVLVIVSSRPARRARLRLVTRSMRFAVAPSTRRWRAAPTCSAG